MDFLGSLVRPSLNTAPAPRLLVVDEDKLDPNTTPASFYTTIKSGGSVVWDEAAVTALASRYFTVASHDVTPAEAAWLEANSQAWVAHGRPKLIWFATCPTGAVVKDGAPVCGRALPSGVQEIPPRPGTSPCSVESLPEVADGSIRMGELEAVKRMAPQGATVCFRYFGGNPEVSDAQASSARETVRVYDQLTQTVQQVEAHRAAHGVDLTVAQKNALAFARSWLTTNAQPVEKARPFLFGGAKNQLRMASGRARFGVEPLTAAVVFAVVIGLCFVTQRAATAFLADAENRAKGIEARAGIAAAMQPRIAELTACVKDTSRSQAQRKLCADALRSLNSIAESIDPDKGGGGPTWIPDAMKYGAIGLGVVGAIYLFGPAIRGASQASAQSFRVSEQRSRTRRKLLADIAG